MPQALVIGHNGQDGVCLTRQLEAKGYAIRGIGSADAATFDVTKYEDMQRLLAETAAG